MNKKAVKSEHDKTSLRGQKLKPGHVDHDAITMRLFLPQSLGRRKTQTLLKINCKIELQEHYFKPSLNLILQKPYFKFLNTFSNQA